MNVKKIPLGPLETNCYIISNQERALIMDPGGDGEKLISWLSDNKINPKAVLLTHAHFDHIGAVDELRDHYNIPVFIHLSENEWLTDSKLNGSALFPVDKIACSRGADYFFETGTMNIEGFQFEVRHTPGHSPGGVVFIFHRDKIIIGGDSLFQLGIGRTDLPGGDYNQLLESIRNQLLSLDDDFKVYPGHGMETTIGNERQNNPFINQ